MNREIYRKIAKKHGITVEEVQKEMQSAIDGAYNNPNAAILAVPKKGDKPTPEEFIAHVVQMVQSEENFGR